MLATRIYPCLSSLFRVFKRKYAFEDFAIRQVALFLNKTADEAKYANRSLVRAPFLVFQAFALKLSARYQRIIGIFGILMSRVTVFEVTSFIWNALATSELVRLTRQPTVLAWPAGFMQKRFANGTFATEDPADCSPRDQQKRVCTLESDNTVGFYESSSWEYSWFAPHDMAHLITLMGGNVSKFRRVSASFFGVC